MQSITPGRKHQEQTLPRRWDQRRRRLALLSHCRNGTTFRCATRLGVGKGWRCLEVGAGDGLFAEWLSAHVGPTGIVVAVDPDVGLSEWLTDPNVYVRQIDLASDKLPLDECDFVHTRWALTESSEREQVLARLCAALRPGGLLMIEEWDVFSVLATATGAYRDGWHAFLSAHRADDIDVEWARGLPARLTGLGLVAVDAALDVPLFRGGSTAAELWSLTLEQARERGVGLGDTGTAIDRARAELTDEHRWFHGPATVTAWGRRAED